MFSACQTLPSLDLSGFDTSNVTAMYSMFAGCGELSSLNISNWDTRKVTDMRGMFGRCKALTVLDLSAWNTENVTDLYAMFSGCSALTSLNVTGWDTSKVEDMSAIFNACTSLTTIDISAFDTSSVTDMSDAFRDCTALEKLDLSRWDTSKAKWMSSTFQGCRSLTSLDLSNWNTKNVTNMESLFAKCKNLTHVNVNGWDTSSVKKMSYMFSQCSSLASLDISGWVTSNVTEMNNMFADCPSLTTIYGGGGFSIGGLSQSQLASNTMFSNDTSLVGGEGTSYNADHADPSYAHIDGGTSNPGYFTEKHASFVPKAGQYGEQDDIAGNVATVTVTNLKEGSTAKLYQIVDGYYKDGKLVKYVLMDPDNGKIAAIGDSSKGQSDSNDIITEDEITTIANNIQTGTFAYSDGEDMTVSGTTATANVEPGMYLVLASDPSGEVVYNPAVVAVNITDVNNGTLSAGSVDLASFFTTSDGSSTKSAYLKYSESGADSKISGSSKAGATDVVSAKSAYGDTVAKGDTIHFQISDMHIPSFSADYTAPKFSILDTIDDSFAPYSNLKVAVGGADVAAGDSTYTVSANGNAFRIDFTSDYLRGLRGSDASARTVSVSFDTVLSNAKINFAENHNRAAISYSNDPADETSLRTIDKDTYIYTFGIDTSIDSDDENAASTYEFNKVSELFNSSTEQWVNQKSANALVGATFTLYSDEDFTAVVKTVDQTAGTAISDADGHITFTGLDEGTYYLKETSAPSGYGLADQTYRFTISADLNADGTLKGYSIAKAYKDATHTDWTDAGTDTYTATITLTDDGSVTNTITRTEAPVAIVNTRLQALPSTGGSGIVLIVSFGIAAGAIGFAMSKKRKLA